MTIDALEQLWESALQAMPEPWVRDELSDHPDTMYVDRWWIYSESETTGFEIDSRLWALASILEDLPKTLPALLRVARASRALMGAPWAEKDGAFIEAVDRGGSEFNELIDALDAFQGSAA
jgi:hypothetical protein